MVGALRNRPSEARTFRQTGQQSLCCMLSAFNIFNSTSSHSTKESGSDANRRVTQNFYSSVNMEKGKKINYTRGLNLVNRGLAIKWADYVFCAERAPPGASNMHCVFWEIATSNLTSPHSTPHYSYYTWNHLKCIELHGSYYWNVFMLTKQHWCQKVVRWDSC